MNITAEDLIELVNEARKGVDVIAPYFGSSIETHQMYLEYVCPQLLISNLQHFIEANKK